MSEKVSKKNSGLAIAALVLGILSVIPYGGIVSAVLAIVFGAIKRDEQFGKVGLILGIVGIVVAIVMAVCLYIFVFKTVYNPLIYN